MSTVLKILFVLATQVYWFFEGLTEFRTFEGVSDTGRYHRNRMFESTGIAFGWWFAFHAGAWTGIDLSKSLLFLDFNFLLLGCLCLGQGIYELAFTVSQGGWENLWYKPYTYTLRIFGRTITINRGRYSRQLYAVLSIVGMILIWRGV